MSEMENPCRHPAFHPYYYQASLLMAVPAVHYQSAFARQVYHICSDPVSRPDGIAVELGHWVVVELVRFLKKLKQGGTAKAPLPIMLGLKFRNNYLHPDFYQRALLLQEFYNTPLYELRDDILSERLSFTKWSTLYISPTDSIIEAVRCAIELNIPVYGVDMSGCANTKQQKYSIEDPQCAHSHVVEYGHRVMKYCHTGRDLHIDFNREVFMAAGLKFCMSKHKKLLFTCGMAHWKSIGSLLDDPSVLPYPVYKKPERIEICRCTIHPALATAAMELIPQVTFEYEKGRYPVISGRADWQAVDSELLIRNCLDETYQKYTAGEKEDAYNSITERWNNINLFEQYLFHLSAVRLRKIPDASTLIAAAEAMMDEEFCRLLTQQLMQVSPAWASLDDFPDLPVICPTDSNKGNANPNNPDQRVRLHTKKQTKDAENAEKEFFICGPETDGNGAANVFKYWEGPHYSNNSEETDHYFEQDWIWPPCESLLFGMAYKAAEISNGNQNRFSGSQTFEGSLEAGIDIKATIRSLIRGEKKTYVNKLATVFERSIIDGINPDPFVFIFQKSPEVSSARWRCFYAGVNHENYVKDQELYSRITRKYGGDFVSSFMFQEEIEPPQHLKRLVSSYFKLYGALLFGNPCINTKQGSIWLESCRYRCCPILFDYNVSSLRNYYRQYHNLDIDLSNWQESLIRMAIPFAKRSVTIIADDSFHFSDQVRNEAERKKVPLSLVSYSNFSHSQLEEARYRFSIKTLDPGGNHYPPETEMVIGQPKNTYLEMLPHAIRSQVGYDEKSNYLMDKIF